MELNVSEVLEISWPNHHEYLCDEIGRLFENQVESDIEFVLKSDGKSQFVQSLKSHSLILKLFCQARMNFASPQFCFEDDSIEIQDVRCLLEFVYRGKSQVKGERLEAVKKAAEKLGFGVLYELLDVVTKTPKRQVHLTSITKLDHDFGFKGNVEDNGVEISMTIPDIINSREKIESTEAISNQMVLVEVPVSGNSEVVKNEQILSTNKENNSCSEKMKCSVCDKRFKNETNFFRHIKLHQNHRKPAEKRKFDELNGTEIIEKGQRKYRCDINECSRCYTSEANLQKHQRKVHSMKISLSCEHCEAVYTSKTRLNKHLQNHLSEKMICDICGLTVRQKSSMRAHMRIHELVKRFKCPLCDYRCREKFALKQHILRIHKLADAEANAVLADVSETNEVNEEELLNQAQCNVCGRYIQKKTMQKHLRAHALRQAGGKKFKCLVSGCAVTHHYQCNLKYHLKRKHKMTTEEIEELLNGQNECKDNT